MKPIIETFKKKHKELVFFGSRHEASKPTLNAIKDAVASFKPQIILLEGTIDEAEFASEAQAVHRGLDQGYLVYLARKKKIPIGPNDPPKQKLCEALSKKYGRDLAYLFYLIQGIPVKTKIHFEMYLRNDIGRFRQEVDWEDFDYSFSRFKKLVKKHLKKDWSKIKNFSDYWNPTLNLCILNEVSRYEDVVRDSFMIRQIKKMLKKYNRVFVIKGSSHLFWEQENIQKIFDNL